LKAHARTLGGCDDPAHHPGECAAAQQSSIVYVKEFLRRTQRK
jgi:hypothetical protein